MAVLNKLSRFNQLVFILAGLICTGIAIIAVWIPGLPTTGFILIALWLFSNSSPRLRNWLLKIPVLGAATHEALRFQTEGTVSLKAKLVSQLCAWGSFVIISLATDNIWLTLITGLLAASCSLFMYKVPTARPVILAPAKD